MAEGNSGSNTGIVAIVVIFLVVIVLAFLAYNSGLIGGSKKTSVDVNISAPSPSR